MDKAKEKTKKPSLIAQIMRHAGTKKSNYTASVIFAILGVICSMVPYYLIGKIVSMLVEGERDISSFAPPLIMIAAFWTLRALFHSISTSLSHVATFSVLGNIRKAICKKLTRVPLGDVQSIPSGSLKNIIVERVDSMETTLAHILPEFTANIVAPILLFIYICTINYKLALASLLTLPVGAICMMLMMRGSAKEFANCMEKTKILNETAVEYINGIEVIKAFGKTDSSYERFRTAAHDGAWCYIDWMRRCIVPHSAAFVLTPATLLAVLPIGGFMYLSGGISGVDLIMVLILSVGLLRPLMTVTSYSDDIAKANTIFGEVSSLLEMKEMKRPDKTAVMPKDSEIVLDNVHFGYGKDKEILHGVSLKIESGTVNALVGPSGSGKSTIARLIASLWDADSGSITLGGVDIKKIDQEDYNRLIAYVSQDNYLFNTTVRENIRIGRRGASDAEVEDAAKKCGCHDFIMSLEKGYDTVVGDAGGHLSGGERQRISIARAMLKDAPVVILDEATAYTDPENEALNQRSLASITQGKTLIIIAHRLSTITDADRIFVVKDGALDSFGTHEELLEKSELYSRMWKAHVAAKDTAEGGEENA